MILCAWVEERATALQRMRLKLEELEIDGSMLDRWMTRTEESLRLMERNPSSDSDELSRQARSIKVRSSTDIKQAGILRCLA
jgi:biotin carboxylase